MNLFTFLLFFFDLTSFETSAILKMLLSAVCGGSIGLGREIHRHSAGLKTFSIVCLGSTLIMITNDYIFRYIAQGSGDLSRMAAQVVSGIGFLGAGSIMITNHNRINGLTTAASLWVTAAIGISIGTGFYFGAISGTCIVHIISIFFQIIDKKIMKYSPYMVLCIDGQNEEFMLVLIDYFNSQKIQITNLERKELNKWYIRDVCATVSVKLPCNMSHNKILSEICQLDGIRYVKEL